MQLLLLSCLRMHLRGRAAAAAEAALGLARGAQHVHFTFNACLLAPFYINHAAPFNPQTL